MYAIICKARKGVGMGIEHLALADRRQSGRRFWTSDNPHAIRAFPSKAVAEVVAGKFKYNSPQVVEMAAAQFIIRQQQRRLARVEQERMHEDALDDPSWDAHKDWS